MIEQKLTFNFTYYPAFQNVGAIMKELHILVTPHKEHWKYNVPVKGFWIGKSLKNFLVRAALPILNENRRCKPCGKKTTLKKPSLIKVKIVQKFL